jgi:hypothetical protein
MSEILKEYKERQKNGKFKYFIECKCDCGKIFSTRKDGKAKSCGCLNKQINKTRRLGKPAYNKTTNYERVKQRAINLAYRIYRDGDISIDKFIELSQKECFYCHIPPSNKIHIGKRKDGTPRNLMKRKAVDGSTYYTKVHAADFDDSASFTYNGLDRIDQTKPHNLNNVVTCCCDCNMMKRSKSKEEFINKIKRIYECIMKNN